jgi:hypothetical protein
VNPLINVGVSIRIVHAEIVAESARSRIEALRRGLVPRGVRITCPRPALLKS